MPQIETAVGFAEPPAAKTLLNSNPTIVSCNDSISQTDIFERHTYPFFQILEGADASYTFQTFGDKTKNSKLARQFHGRFDKYKYALACLNQLGAGIFVTVNQTDGRGRRKENIIGLRALFVDIDSKGATEPFVVDKLPLKPSMVVKTPGGCHCYWVFEKPEPCDEKRRNEFEQELRRIQAGLAKFGADRACCDCSRVLRIPGFFHQKGESVLVTLEVNHA